ncbi:MAG: T9SS type A sorting domain-containing protein [Bacteroidota bacterium]
MIYSSSKLIRGIFFLCAVTCYSSVNAQWGLPTVNNEVYAGTGNQRDAQIASDGSGNLLVAWTDNRSGNNDIYAQKISGTDGSRVWTAAGVAICTATGVQDDPVIISDGSGGAIIAWTDARSGDDLIYAQRIDQDGNVQWTANGVQVVNVTNSNFNTRPAMVSDGSGGAIITWCDERSSVLDIYAQKLNAAGVAQWTANGVALCTAADEQLIPAIATDGAGGAIVTWIDKRPGGGNQDIYAQRITSGGSVSWTADGVAVCTASGQQIGPTIVEDGSGGVFIAWSDGRVAQADIYAQHLDASGSRVTGWVADGNALCTATGFQSAPAIDFDGVDGLLVAWRDFRSGDNDVYAHRASGNGSLLWTADGVLTGGGSGDQSQPDIVSDGTGGAFVVYSDFSSGSSNADIMGNILSSSGSLTYPTAGTPVSSASNQQRFPKIISNESDGTFVTWEEDDRNTANNEDVYVALFTTPTAPGGIVGDLAGWFKADADVKNGGLDVTSGAVDQWDNQVGNASLTSLTQSTGSREPEIVDSDMNFNPVVRFDGTTDIYQENVDSDDFRGNTSFTIYTVLLKPGGSNTFWGHKETGSGNDGKLSLSTSAFSIGAAFNNDYGSNSVGAATYLGTDPVLITNDLNGANYSGFKNGEYVWANTGLSVTSETGTFGLGALVNGTSAGFHAIGDIAEMVLFSQAQSAADRQKVMSYLALKYGITLENADNDGAIAEGDYIASDDAIIWDGDLSGANASYHNHVTGIGRDDFSQLSQVKSKSTRAGSVLGVALTDQGGSYATPNSFDNDLEFLVLGDNGGDMTTLGSTVNGVDNAAVARIWKVQETGTIGNVTLRIAASDLPSGTYHLFVSDNSSFTAGSVSQHLLNENGADMEVSVDFNDGDFFTLGTIAPGGIGSGITNWFKANSTRVKLAGSTATSGVIDEWENEFANLDILEVTQTTPAERPSVMQDALNFNPVIEMEDGEWLFKEDVLHTAYRTTTAVSLYGVYNTNKSGENGNAFIHMDEGGDNNSKVSLGTEFAAWSKPGGPTYSNPVTSDFAINAVVVEDGNTDSSWVAWRNGAFDRRRNDGQIDPAIGATGWFSIGGLKTDALQDFYLDGNLAELVIYNQRHDDNDRESVESYLAVKYGITLAHDYKRSDGSTVWGITINAGYNNDIAGIGLDGRSALNQTRSRSNNSDGIVTIEASSLTNDGSFLIWGNNDLPLTQSEQTDVNGTTIQVRLERVWKVQGTGSVGTVDLTFDLSGIPGEKVGGNLFLLIDRDGSDFAVDDVAPQGGTLIGDDFTVTGVSLQDGDLFTLGNAQLPAPGGVSSGLQVWLDAGTGAKNGVNDATDGQVVNTWEDISGSRTNDATDADNNLPPTLRANLSNFNFNNALEFDGETVHLDFGSDYIFSTGTGLTAFAIIRPDNVAAKTAPMIFDFGNLDTQSYGIGYSSDFYRLHTPTGANGVKTESVHTRGATTTLMRSQIDFGNEQYVYLDGTFIASDPIPLLNQLTTAEINQASDDDSGSGPFMIGRQSKTFGLSNNGGRGFDGLIAEIILYDEDLSALDAQKVETYLALKYGLTLGQNMISSSGSTIWDNTANATYSFDVSGIGRDDDANLLKLISKSSNDDGIVTMEKPGGLSADETFLAWGNDDASMNENDQVDVDGTTIEARMKRVWQIAETGDAGTVTVTFDVSAIPGTVNGNDLRLLIDRDADFSTNDVPLLSGTLVGNDFIVTAVDFQDGDRFTLGTVDVTSTTLPIELSAFSAQVVEGLVALDWTTATETNNSHFDVERSRAGTHWEVFQQVAGAGTSVSPVDYHTKDQAPYSPVSYYRLKQVDFDGEYSYSPIERVSMGSRGPLKMNIYPSPNFGEPVVIQVSGLEAGEPVTLQLLNNAGSSVYRHTELIGTNERLNHRFNPNRLQPGIYLLRLTTNQQETTQRIIINLEE